MGPKVLICDSFHRRGISILNEAGFEVDYEPDIEHEDVIEKIGGYHAAIVRSRTKIDGRVIEKASSLKVIVRAGAGLDNVDVEAAEAKGIKVISTPDALTNSVAELSIGLMLSVLRGLSHSDHSMKRGEWIKKQLVGRELRGKTVGVIGAGGRIGLQLCRMLIKGFGAQVIGYDVVDIKDMAEEVGFKVASSLEELLSESDIVTLHIPYLQSTHHLINREMIDKMKQGAILINTARGRIVDGKALLQAIKEGRIGGAGLDVYHDEPPKENWERELVSHTATVCTSHIGAQTKEAQELAAKLAVEEIIHELA